MDVDRDGQHPSNSRPSAVHSEDKDTMNTSLDTTQSSATEVKIPGLLTGNDVVTTQQPTPAPVLDQPRETEAEGGSAAEQSQSQLGKTH